MASETQNIVPSTGSPHNLIITFWVAPSAQNNAELFWPGKKKHTQLGEPEGSGGGIHFDFNLMLGQHNNIVSLYRKEPHRRRRGRIVVIVGVLCDCVIVGPWVASCQLVVGCCFGPSSSPSSMAAEGLPYKRLTRRLPSLQTLLPFWPSLCGPFFGTLKIL